MDADKYSRLRELALVLHERDFETFYLEHQFPPFEDHRRSVRIAFDALRPLRDVAWLSFQEIIAKSAPLQHAGFTKHAFYDPNKGKS